MLASVKPTIGPIKDFSTTHIHWGASTRSLLLLIALGLIALGPLAYIYWRDWRLRRGFRRYCQSCERKDDLGPDAPPPPRQPLVKDRRTKRSVPKAAETEKGEGGLADGEWERWGKQAPAIWLSHTQTRSPRAADSPARPSSAKRGVVNVHAEGDVYEVFVDGAFVGNTPARVTLEEALHVVEIKGAGCQDYRRELQVSAGAEQNLRVVLERVDARTDGAASDSQELR